MESKNEENWPLIAVEIDSLLKSKFTYVKIEHVGKFDVYNYKINGNQIIAIHSGCGQIKAAAATELLISLYHVGVLFIKGISDSLHGGKEEFLDMYKKSSDVCLKIVMQLLEQELI